MAETTLTKKDFQTDQEVRWCPGCGDYAILSSAQQTFADLGRWLRQRSRKFLARTQRRSWLLRSGRLQRQPRAFKKSFQLDVTAPDIVR